MFLGCTFKRLWPVKQCQEAQNHQPDFLLTHIHFHHRSRMLAVFAIVAQSQCDALEQIGFFFCWEGGGYLRLIMQWSVSKLTVKQTCLLLSVYHSQEKFINNNTVFNIYWGWINHASTTSYIEMSKGQAGKLLHVFALEF